LPAGGRPAATYFSLLRQRNSKQKKGDRRLALRVPVYVLQKMENERNSLRSDNVHFLSIFCSTQTAASQAVEIQQQRQK
jgi:hypothetical protein